MVMTQAFSEEIKEWDDEKLLGVLTDTSWRLEEHIRRAEYDAAREIGEEVNLLKYEALRRMKRQRGSALRGL